MIPDFPPFPELPPIPTWDVAPGVRIGFRGTWRLASGLGWRITCLVKNEKQEFLMQPISPDGKNWGLPKRFKGATAFEKELRRLVKTRGEGQSEGRKTA